MKLEYHRGRNFGDALNPIIFNHFTTIGSVKKDDNCIIIGIGSILGLKIPAMDQSAIVFSSGYAAGATNTYGPPPVITSNYKIICVRGPLTAKVLKLSPDMAVTDGAILLAAIPLLNKPQIKQHDVSFIPHVGSLDFFDWASLCRQIGINFIDPRDTPEKVIKQIQSSKKILTEAMHGAIVADTFRVPWIAVKAYKTINNFKWTDWCMSMEIEYNPTILCSLFDKRASNTILHNKLPVKSLTPIINQLYNLTITPILRTIVIHRLKHLVNSGNYQLSSDKIFKARITEMLHRIGKLNNTIKETLKTS